MATENKGVMVYLPPELKKVIEEYCKQNNLTRKNKDGEAFPSLGTGIGEQVAAIEAGGPKPADLPELPMPTFQLAFPEVSTTFDISTGHVEQRDMELLVACGKDSPFCTVYPYEEGVMVVVSRESPVDPEEILAYGFSPAMVEVYLQAQHMRAKFINLDRDGADYAELPSFDW